MVWWHRPRRIAHAVTLMIDGRGLDGRPELLFFLIIWDTACERACVSFVHMCCGCMHGVELLTG